MRSLQFLVADCNTKSPMMCIENPIPRYAGMHSYQLHQLVYTAGVCGEIKEFSNELDINYCNLMM